MKSTKLVHKLSAIRPTVLSSFPRVFPPLALSLGLLCLAPAPGRTAPLTSPPRVLILDETVYGGATSQEAVAAQLAIPGCAVDIVSAANWAAVPATGTGGPTGYGFDSYRAIILGDPICTGDSSTYGTGTAGYLSALNTLNATKLVWTPVVTGNVILEGVDNAFHSSYQVGADKLLKRGIGFAVNDPTKTGLYYALSCYYDYTAPAVVPTLVPHLTGFGTFMTRNYPNTCFNDAHIVATHAVFTAAPPLTDAELSNWGCSTHEGFDVWPPNFVVLAIALTNGAYTASDGSNGVPYVLVRGEGVKVITTINLGPPAATNDLGTTHTVCATLATNVSPFVGVPITFSIISGPNAVTNYTAVTDGTGTACFTYTGVGGPGIDYITASYLTSSDRTNFSDTVTKLWVPGSCIGLGCESLDCLADGTYNYSFCVTNLGSAAMNTLNLQAVTASVTINPSVVNLAPPLTTGQSTNLTVNIGAPVGTTGVCFKLISQGLEGTAPCHIPHCITLPTCCTRVTTNTLTYAGSLGGTNIYNYSITLQNITASPLKYLAFGPDQPCVTFVPPLVDLSLPAYGGPSLLLPAQTRTVNLQVRMSAPCTVPHNFSFSTLDSNLVACCSSRLTLPKPGCIILTSPYDGSVVLTNMRVSFIAIPVGPCGYSTVMFYADSTLVGVADKAPFSLDVTFPNPGTYSLTAVGVLSTGELDTSPPAQLSVIVPGTDPDQHPLALSAAVSAATVSLNVPTAVGHHYVIQYRTNLVDGQWSTLSTLDGDGTLHVVRDSVTNDSSRFYRAVIDQ